MLQDDYNNINESIEDWDKKNLGDLRSQISALNIKHVKRSPNKISLQKALRSKIRKRSGLTDRISYIMPRSAIFLHKGVSKGHPITNPREAKKWFDPVVEKNIGDLVEIVAEGSGNLIINNIKIQ